MSPPTDEELREVAREAARAEARRLFEKVVYFLAGFGLLTVSATAPAAVTGAGSTGETAVLAGLGLLCFVGGVYLLADGFDVDRAVARWLRRQFA